MYEERKFVRYFTEPIIDIWLAIESMPNRWRLKNVSLGGLAFKSDIPWKTGEIIVIHMLVSLPFKLTAQVVRCKQNGKGFEVGVKLIEKNSDSVRYKKMIANIVETSCKNF